MTLYKVTAPTGYAGRKEGEEFEADLTPDQERRAKARGSLRVVKRQTEKPKEEEGSKDA